MSVTFRFLVYLLINWLGMSDNDEFFDIKAIILQVLALLAAKVAKNG
jgi:hypothetical protein